MLNRLKKKGRGGFVPIFPCARIIPLHVMLSGCGYGIEEQQSYRWDGQKRGKNEFCIFQYTLSGYGELIWEGEKFELPAGTSFLVHIPHNHVYYLPPKSAHWEFIYFSLVGREALALWLNIEKLCGPVVKINNNSKLINRIAEIYCAGKEKIKNPYEASSIAYEFLMLLCQEIFPKSHSRSEPQFISDVINFCIENIGREVDVDEMAGIAGLSRYHFSRLFKKSQGVSPGVFLTNLRMKHALRLIQTEQLSIKEIAEICGYNDTSYFCKVFKRYFNLSPEKFRTVKVES